LAERTDGHLLPPVVPTEAPKVRLGPQRRVLVERALRRQVCEGQRGRHAAQAAGAGGSGIYRSRTGPVWQRCEPLSMGAAHRHWGVSTPFGRWSSVR